MNDYLTWGALVGALGALITSIKFWMDLGKELQVAKSDAAEARADAKAVKEEHRSDVKALRDDVKAARDEANQARSMVAMVNGKHDILISTLSDLRVEFARDYVSHKALNATEDRFTSAVDGVRTELAKISDRIYQILDRVSAKT